MLNALRHRSTALAVLTAGAVAAASALLTGCSGSGLLDCTSTSLGMRDVRLTGYTHPFSLRGDLTADGKPLAGVELNFWIYTGGAGTGSPAAGQYLGTEKTGPDGVAVLEEPSGPAALSISGRVQTGFGVELPGGGPAGGTKYCAAKKRVKINCDFGSTPGRCPPVPLFPTPGT